MLGGGRPRPILGFVSGIEIRDATAADEAFLWRMLDFAGGDPEMARSVEELRCDDALSRYVEGWGREGDIGVVASNDRGSVGAAWLRVFDHERPGYGYVDDTTPELAIFLTPGV